MIWEIFLIAISFALILVFSLLSERGKRPHFRAIKAYQELRKRIELSVEDGTRLHVSLGRGGVLGAQSAAAFAGLSLLREVSQIASDSDQPPLASAGEGALAVLAQDTLRANYQALNIREEYTNLYAQLLGTTPQSYAAGLMPLLLDEEISASSLVGSYGSEAALATAASQRSQSFVLGGSDGLGSQAIFYATANEVLLAEEVYAAGAYLGAGAAYDASLRSQDILRALIVVIIVGLTINQLIGLLF